MERHPYFDLLLHTVDELETILRCRVIRRQTLHEWPLSCVQLVVLEDGRRKVYKSSSGPTLEAQFYAQARSSLIIHGETIYRDDAYTCMVFEYLDAPRLCDRKVGEKEAYQIGQTLAAEISRVEGSYPVYQDISSWTGWRLLMAEMVGYLRSLVFDNKFRIVTNELIDELSRIASSAVVQEIIEGSSSLVHRDLTDDNIFLVDGGYRVIDWQRPIRGPVGLDIATLADSLGFDPEQWAGRGAAQTMALLNIQWLTEAAVRWFPAGMDTYDRQIFEISRKIR